MRHAIGARGTTSDLEAEIRREVSAYEPEGLVVVVREPGRVSVAPGPRRRLRLAGRSLPAGTPRTIELADAGAALSRAALRPRRAAAYRSNLGISLAETEATLAAFDRLVAGGAVVFLILAIVGGMFLSRQALRPVAESIRAARRLDPEDLSERLPRTGAGDELDELAGTINGLLDRLAAYHAQIIRFTADASHELRSPLGAMRAAIEVALSSRASRRNTGMSSRRSASSASGSRPVNGLLLLARADAGEVVIKREPIDLAAVAREVVEMFEPLAEERRNPPDRRGRRAR